jgi:ACS family hexuronate transporter-like MFS transporter
VAFITTTHNVWIATMLAGFAAGGHQGMAANLYTMTSDLFPKRAVGSVVGMGSAFGSIVAMGFSFMVGAHLQSSGSYALPFIIAGVGYPLTVLFIHIMSPRWEPLDLTDKKRGFDVI